jgi:hypothetical protein
MSDDKAEWGIVMPFWIDTDGYTDRDREMFVCGVEFQMLYEELKAGGPVCRGIHSENESRARMMAHKMGRKCTIEPVGGDWWEFKAE